MMRRAGTPPEHNARLISKSYCSAYGLEGQISIGLAPVLPAHAPAFSPGLTNHAPHLIAAPDKGVTGH
jgi:hypothetical protein